MSPYLPQAVIATEDRRFYSHFGVDPIGLLRAAAADLAAGHVVEGGSTITQQLAKNLFLTPERSLARKIRETLLALWLEHRFTKDEILEIYLNRVYLGAGTYGVDAAAHRYFGDVGVTTRPLSERDDRRAAEGAGAVQPDPRPRPRRGAHRAGARQHGRSRLHHAGRGRSREPGAKRSRRDRRRAGRGTAISPIGSRRS